jgi:ABC-type nitrate/sulfonate/bicarbonate transport system substrate-binding protein
VKHRHRPVVAGITVLLALVVGACDQGRSASPPRSGGPGPSASGEASTQPSAGPSSVRLALDWTPNTAHAAFYAARHEGWYEEAGAEVTILPYTGTTPEALLAAGQAECGISFHDSLTFAVAAGVDITSVMAILQHTSQEIAVLASSDIQAPKDLDGKVYAGFGYPNEEPTLRAVIRADGGRGEFRNVTLDSAAYEALYAERADFAIIFSHWEGIEAAQREIELRTFEFTDYGFPDFYQIVLACDRGWLERSPDLARAFVAASVRGLELAARRPDTAAAILVEENPAAFASNRDVPLASARYLAENGLLVDSDGAVGRQRLQQWQPYSQFLYDEGLLVDADGDPLTSPPNYEALFTDEYLPQPGD